MAEPYDFQALYLACKSRRREDICRVIMSGNGGDRAGYLWTLLARRYAELYEFANSWIKTSFFVGVVLGWISLYIMASVVLD